tara:strand:- start:1201 stop:1365 length:165 start_codon:yes stop_codon:yes gene_type:complete
MEFGAAAEDVSDRTETIFLADSLLPTVCLCQWPFALNPMAQNYPAKLIVISERF